MFDVGVGRKWFGRTTSLVAFDDVLVLIVSSRPSRLWRAVGLVVETVAAAEKPDAQVSAESGTSRRPAELAEFRTRIGLSPDELLALDKHNRRIAVADVERAELTADGDWDVAVLHLRGGEQLKLYSEAPRGRREHLAEVFAELFGDRLAARPG
jgi:hypothetical protein